MPELPEVETVRAGLERALTGKKIVKIRVRETRLRVPITPARLRRWLLNQTVAAVERRAKYVLCRMENEAHLIIHLGMSGRLLWCDGGLPLDKHDHVLFALEDGDELRFRDPRRFGLVDAIPPGKMESYGALKKLGIEPFSQAFTAELLQERAQGLRRPIKNYLMDAGKIVGIGNIYANEALFRAGLHPQSMTGALQPGDWRKLVQAIRETLELAIASGGTTLNDFYNSDGEMGYFQQYLKVYDRAGERCEVCGTKIRRLVQVGRSSYFCPRCQKRRTLKKLR